MSRAIRYVVRCIGIAFRGSLALANGWSALLGGTVTGAILSAFGVDLIPNGILGGVVMVIICTVASWCAIFLARLVSAPFAIHKEDEAEIARLKSEMLPGGVSAYQLRGTWHGTKFVLADPLVIHTAVATAADNDRMQVFEVPYAPAHTLVEIIVDIDRRDERVKAGVVFSRTPENPPWRWNNRATRTSLRLLDDRLLALRTHAEPEADATTIRVRMASWTVGG